MKSIKNSDAALIGAGVYEVRVDEVCLCLIILSIILYVRIVVALAVKCHEEVLYLQPIIVPKCFDLFPPDWVLIFLETRI